jgi:thiaminase
MEKLKRVAYRRWFVILLIIAFILGVVAGGMVGAYIVMDKTNNALEMARELQNGTYENWIQTYSELKAQEMINRKMESRMESSSETLKRFTLEKIIDEPYYTSVVIEAVIEELERGGQ